MFRCGVLVIPSAYKDLHRRLPSLLFASAGHVNEVLYIDILQSEERSTGSLASLDNTYSLLKQTYSDTLKVYRNLDIRVILSKGQSSDPSGLVLSRKPEVAITVASDETRKQQEFESWLYNRYNNSSVKQIKYIEGIEVTARDFNACNSNKGLLQEHVSKLKSFPGVVLGGTFDKIHNGHRLLLSVACLLCESKITVGLSDGKLLENKTLTELIDSFETRKKMVEDFISDIKPELIQNIIPITDPMGPTATESDFDCLVLSQETERGGELINKTRQSNGLESLEIHSIDIIVDDEVNGILSKGKEEVKLSSTFERHHLLGKLLKPVVRRPKQTWESYVIGITGGIGSGKSAICERLRKLGANIVNCDKLGHQAYLPGTNAHKRIVETFGQHVLAEDGSINRKTLGGIVFKNKDMLDALNNIVWPEISQLAQQQIRQCSQDGYKVSVLDAAVLLEAGWDKLVDEVWVSIVPPSEAVTRIVDRDRLTEEEALKRINSQMSNSERVAKAHVVLSTLWETEYTQKQVERAWKDLQDRMAQCKL